MRMPPGCGSICSDVVLLNKTLYGLKQAARMLHELLILTLHDFGFEKHSSERCVLGLRDSESGAVMLAVHVDDIIVEGSKEDTQ